MVGKVGRQPRTEARGSMPQQVAGMPIQAKRFSAWAATHECGSSPDGHEAVGKVARLKRAISNLITVRC